MTTPDGTDIFYGRIPVFRGFGSLMDPAMYAPLPDDWTLGVADIVESTKAIANQRYKAVNMAGASVIAAVANAMGIQGRRVEKPSEWGNRTFNGARQPVVGVTWDEAAIKSRVITNGDTSANSISGYNDGTNRIYGLDGNDYLYGGALADTLDGGIGDDNLSGNAGADILLGGVGNDSLSGGADADTLDGGVGSDALDGGLGNDTYKFGKGDGQDVIGSDMDAAVGKLNTLQFEPDVAYTDVVSSRKGNDLILAIANTSDQVTISNFFSPEECAELIRASELNTFEAAPIITPSSGSRSITARATVRPPKPLSNIPIGRSSTRRGYAPAPARLGLARNR